MEKNKVLAMLILSWLLASCTSTDIETKSSDDNVSTTETSVSAEEFAQNVQQAKEEINSSVETNKLAISSKCVWCSHCVKFAPENFSMDNTRKAIVISQDNIGSADVEKAIDRCPTKAISIS